MGWETQSLDNLCDFKNGLWKGKRPPFVKVGVIRNTNFTKGGILDDSDIAYLEVEKKQYETRRLEFGDLILEKSGGGPKQAVGRVIAFEKEAGEFSFSNFTSIIRIKDKTRLHHSFLHKFLYFLYEIGVTETMQRQSTGIRNLQLKEYKLIDVPLPPIPEQKRIVAILDQAFADIDKACANAEQNLKNARELFDSYLQQVFSQRGEGWVDKPLGEICNFLNGFAFKSADAVDESNVQLIRMGNLYKNVLDLDRKPSYYPSEFSEVHSRYLLNEGDLIISLTGTTGKRDFGFTVEIPMCEQKLLLNQRIAKIIEIDNKQVEKQFLLRILKSKSFLDELYASANGTRQANLSTSALKDIEITYPSIFKQKELIAVFDMMEQQVQSLEGVYQTKLETLDELKKSFLQKAFSGELTKGEGMAA